MKLKKGDIRNKKILIGGIQGSGKTHLAKYLSKFFKCAVYTPHGAEWRDTKAVLLKPDDFITDFNFFCKFIKLQAIKKKVNCFIIDEADMLFKTHFSSPSAFRDLVINHRHYKLTLIFVTRRLQDIPAKFYGQCEIMCLFQIDNPHTVGILEKYYDGLGKKVRNLGYNSFDFYYRHIGQPPVKTYIR